MKLQTYQIETSNQSPYIPSWMWNVTLAELCGLVSRSCELSSTDPVQHAELLHHTFLNSVCGGEMKMRGLYILTHKLLTHA